MQRLKGKVRLKSTSIKKVEALTTRCENAAYVCEKALAKVLQSEIKEIDIVGEARGGFVPLSMNVNQHIISIDFQAMYDETIAVKHLRSYEGSFAYVEKWTNEGIIPYSGNIVLKVYYIELKA